MSGTTNNASGRWSQNLRQGVKSLLKSRIAETLAYPHGVDRYLEYINPAWSLNEIRASVISKCSQTSDTVTLKLRPNSNWQGFKPGQYLRFSVSIDGSLRTRCFSPVQSAHADDGLIEITAKLPADAFVTRHMRDRLDIGDVVTLSQAEGEFALPDTRPQRIVLISGGSGITPVMSMLRTLCDEGHQGAITFLHYNNRYSDQLYADELDALSHMHPNLKVLRCYAQDTHGELNGLFSEAQLAAAIPDFDAAETFLCGPPGLMQAVEAVYAARACIQRLHVERFTLAAAPVASENPAGDVRFARSERLAANSGQTLLEQAESAGLRPEHGCRMGVCYACTCRKTSGRVRDLRTGQLSEDGEQDIQICVSVPEGSVTLDI